MISPGSKLLSTVFLVLALPVGAVTITVDGAAPQPAPADATTPCYATITEALKSAQAGDRVEIRAGVYRGPLVVPGGKPGHPLTLAAAEGARVIISGMQPVAGWQPHTNGLYVTRLSYRPTRLFVGVRREPLAREPNEGWWLAPDAGDEVIQDPAHLAALGYPLGGGEVYVWTQAGNIFHTVRIRELDAAKGRIEVERTSKWMKLGPGDKYALQNHPALIDRPGEWACTPDGDGWRVYYRPRNAADLARTETPRAGSVVTVRGSDHLVLRGLEITGGTRHGLDMADASDVLVDGCTIHHNNEYGIGMRACEDVRVARSVTHDNYCGIVVMYSSHVTVEENEIAYNGMDGLLFTWQSSNLVARRNYIHDHQLWGHPDNMQFHNGVTDVKIIDNLMLVAGQSVMMQDTSRGEYRGNMIIGSSAAMLIFGHGTARDYRIRNNTLAFAGFGCMTLTADRYDVAENVFMSGSQHAICQLRGVSGYTGKRNLYWNADGVGEHMVLASDHGWHRSLESFQRATGQDKDSIYANPRFRNAPAAMAVLDQARIQDCSRSVLYLYEGTTAFATGDHVEISADGIVRTVTAVTEDAITIAPPLPEKPIKCWQVANWRQNRNFALDLRLQPDSPGAAPGADGQPIGSRIDIEAYRRGDFNGDGQRDIPPLRRVPLGISRHMRYLDMP